jgi:hypothetical protein
MTVKHAKYFIFEVIPTFQPKRQQQNHLLYGFAYTLLVVHARMHTNQSTAQVEVLTSKEDADKRSMDTAMHSGLSE